MTAVEPLPEPFDAGLRGDLPALVAWVEHAADEGWRAAARALLWLGQPERGEPPTLDVIAAASPSSGATQALALHARAAILSLELDDARRAVALLRGDDPRTVGWRAILEGWLACVVDADAGRAAREAEVAGALARDARLPSLTVEAVLLDALAAVTAGDLHAALDRARRASRMAQAERLWVSHYMVGVVLARLRRLAGRPHLAGLIAGSCHDAAPPAFSGWLRWELLFAGVAPPVARTGSMADWTASRAADLLVRGERAEGDVDALLAGVSRSAIHLPDARAAIAACDPDAPLDEVEPETRAWIEGRVSDPPPALAGLMAPAWSPEAPPLALAPSGRRTVGYARLPRHERLAPSGARAARPEAVAAALALAGAGGVDRAALFESAYGFAFREDIHEASFKVVRHQAKKLLTEHADIERDGERISLAVRAPFAVPDPRPRQPLSEVVLRCLASTGGGSARDVAAQLGVPLRTVQLALKQMTDDGDCVSKKDGRRVAYAVEDTTFCELTRA